MQVPGRSLGGSGEELLIAAISAVVRGQRVPAGRPLHATARERSGYVSHDARGSAEELSSCVLPHLRPAERRRFALCLPAAVGGRDQCTGLLSPTDDRTPTPLAGPLRPQPAGRVAVRQRRTCKHALAPLSSRQGSIYRRRSARRAVFRRLLPVKLGRIARASWVMCAASLASRGSG